MNFKGGLARRLMHMGWRSEFFELLSADEIVVMDGIHELE
jgi:hypothetical protein